MPIVVNTLKYFEDSAKGCAVRLEKLHCVPKFEPDAEIDEIGHLCMGNNYSPDTTRKLPFSAISPFRATDNCWFQNPKINKF
jgi:hypothetical protein